MSSITQEEAAEAKLPTGVQQGVEDMRRINGVDFFKLKNADTFNADLARLPVAYEEELNVAFGEDFQKIPGYKAIMVNMNEGTVCAGIPSDKYKLVQHADAFRPPVEGLTIGGVKSFKYAMHATAKYAKLNIFTDKETTDGVIIGFEMTNNVDGHGSIKYSWDLSNTKDVIEVVGYRYSCLNGCKFRVNLQDAHLVRTELKLEVKTLLADYKAIVHTKNAMQEVEKMQYVAEALAKLSEPVTRMIQQAQKIRVADQEHIKNMLKTYVGKRYASKVLQQFDDAVDYTAWGFYNAMTAVATHDEDLSTSSREVLLDKAAIMLAKVTA